MKQFSPVHPAQAASTEAQTSPTIPVIVRDTTSFYWQSVLAGARRHHLRTAIHLEPYEGRSPASVTLDLAYLASLGIGLAMGTAGLWGLHAQKVPFRNRLANTRKRRAPRAADEDFETDVLSGCLP